MKASLIIQSGAALEEVTGLPSHLQVLATC
jgi:hypothetical protein